MAGTKLFGSNEIGAVTIVDAPVSQWYARRAGVTALVVGLALDALVTAVLSVFCPLLLAVVLGVLAGVVCAFVAAVLVRIWPVLRVLWWWSIEITISLFVLGVWVWLASWLARPGGPAANMPDRDCQEEHVPIRHVSRWLGIAQGLRDPRHRPRRICQDGIGEGRCKRPEIDDPMLAAEQLGVRELEAILNEGVVRELILATNPTVEGEATAHFLADLATKRGIRASRIAHGIPIGGELEYVDGGTLAHALTGRQSVT